MESYLILLLGPLGVVFAVFGIWLYRSGKKIEERVYKGAPVMPDYRSPTKWLGVWTYGGVQDGFPYAPWGRYSTKPLAVLSVLSGIAMLAMFTMSLI